MESEQMSLQAWVVQIVSLGLISTIGFLVKNAFTKVERSLEVMQVTLNSLTGDSKGKEAEIRALERRVQVLEDDVRELRKKQ